MNAIYDLKNPWIRRPLIAFVVLCILPFLSAVLVAEVVWKTCIAFLSILREKTAEAYVELKTFYLIVKDSW